MKKRVNGNRKMGTFAIAVISQQSKAILGGWELQVGLDLNEGKSA